MLEAIERIRIAADLWFNHSRPFFIGLGLRNAHIPYHYPPSFGDLYPSSTSFAPAAHPMLDRSQPTIGWYDQALQSVQGVSTYDDVKKAGGVSLHHAMNQSKAQSVRRNYYATTSYSDAQLLLENKRLNQQWQEELTLIDADTSI